MKKTAILFSIMLFVFLYVFFSCNDEGAKKLKQGEELARVHCASCHAFPEPSLPDKKHCQKIYCLQWQNSLRKIFIINQIIIAAKEAIVADST